MTQDFDVGLSYLEGIPSDYFDDFREPFNDDGPSLHEESRENLTYMSVEWAIPTAIAVYLSLRLFDCWIQDMVYPRIKASVIALAKKALVRDRLKVSVISASESRAAPVSTIFSISARTRLSKSVKFVFHEEVTEVEVEERVEQAFVLLGEHSTNEGGTDQLSEELSKTELRQVYMKFDRNAGRWVMVEVEEVRQRKSTRG